MKILILVQGCDAPPYDKIQQSQMDTWDSIKVPGVETIYYISDESLPKGDFRIDGDKLYVPCSEAYNMMHWRYKLALDVVALKDWDYIFRTNTSSYVDKKMLLDFAKDLPKEKVYCGIKGGDNMASGCGVFLSRDVVNIFIDNFDDHPTPAEDCLMGTWCERKGVPVTEGARRHDYYFHSGELPKLYHYRCKSDTEDRDKDIVAFKAIHKLIHG